MVRVHLLLPQGLDLVPSFFHILFNSRVGIGGDVNLVCIYKATRVTLGSLFRRVSTASLASLSVHSLRSTCFYHNHSIVEWLFFLFSRLEYHPATLPCLSANKVGVGENAICKANTLRGVANALCASPLASTIAYPSEPDDRLGFFLYKSCSLEQDFLFIDWRTRISERSLLT